MNASELPSLDTVIEAYSLRAKKSLGQNFLTDPQLLARIVSYAGNISATHICEIGPGPGGLSRAILDGGAASLTAIERDDRAVKASELLTQAYGERFTIRGEDAMEFSPHTLPAPRAVIANLPYNIGTPLMLSWLDALIDAPDAYQFFLLMFQKEVAQRLTAPISGNNYGRLSVWVQWLCDAEICMDVAPEYFSPPPKVTSSVVRLTPKNAQRREDVGEIATFKMLLNTAFSQRRKMLRKSLKPLGEKAIDALSAIGIDETRRAETLGVTEFAALSRALSK